MDTGLSRTASQPDALLGWMDALADPTRLRLLRLLERHELGVVELCDILQLPQSTVSRHLKVLVDQNWARSRRMGTTHLYRMTLDELEAPTRKLWLIAREQTDDWATVEQDGLRLARLLAEKQQDSQAFFAGAAGQWDKLRDELYGQSFVTEALLALLPADYVVADLGCGTGQTLQRLAPHVSRVIGVDNSPAMLKAAARRLNGREKVELRTGELTAVPIEDTSVDAAIVQLVLSYVPEPQLVLKEMARILKPGGKAVVVDLLPHDRDDFRREMGQAAMGFDPERFCTELVHAGFTDARCTPLPPQANVKGPALFLATAARWA